jgi:hypothetical protein
VVKFSEQARKNISEAQKKRFSNLQEKKRFIENRITTGMKEKHHSEESKRKMSEALKGKVPWIKGKKHTQEELFRMGEAHIGQIPWNKGLKGKYSTSLKGKKRGEEFKKKVSEGHKGKIPWNKNKIGIMPTPWNKGKKGVMPSPWNKGKENPYAKNLPQAFKRGQPTWNKGLIGYQAGEKHPMWKGGISFEPYSLEWTKALKKIVRERDNQTCQLCGKNGKVVHHIDYNKKNCNPENLITLCGSCHSKTNMKREKWIEFFNKKR